MNIARNIVIPLVFASAITACSNSGSDNSVFRYINVLDNTHLAVHAHGAADAIVSADGDLSIAGNNIVVTPSERDLLKGYFASIIALRADAIDTGKAGANTAATAIGSVVAGIASGNADKIGDNVDAQAAKVDAAASMVCTDLANIRTAQSAIADQLAAFKPYALIDASQVQDCKHD